MQPSTTHPRKTAPRHSWRLFAFLLLLLTLVGGFAMLAQTTLQAQSSSSQTLWLARQDGKDYVFDVQIPADFAIRVLASDTAFPTDKSYAKFTTEKVDGKTYNFVRTGFTWDNKLADSSQISYWKGGMLGETWRDVPKDDADWLAFIPHLEAQSAPYKTWSTISVYALITDDATPPTLRLPMPIMDYAVSQMVALSEQTVAGTYFPEVKQPADLDAYRQQMLDYGNAGRRDPDFRKNNGAQTATDLSLDMVDTLGGMQKVFRTSDTPPFFPDHVLDENLNKAAQFQAEFNASEDKAGHAGPSSWTDPATGKVVDMFDMGARVIYFGGANAVEGAGGAAPGGLPHGWMKSETHFRPFFNVDKCTTKIGYGAAQAANGNWYFVTVPNALDSCEDATPAATATPTAAATTAAPAADATATPAADATATPAADATAAPAADDTATPAADATATPAADATATPAAPGFPILPGTTIEQGLEYPSESGDHHLIFQPDGNLVVYDKDGNYVWGLDGETDRLDDVANIVLQPDGNLNVSDANGDWIWSALNANPDASSWLNLSPEGVLQLVSGDTGKVLWASDGDLDAVVPTRTPATPTPAFDPFASTAATVTDADGNEYSTVQIGNQLWMAENLRTTTCSDGTAIPLVDDADDWLTQTASAYIWSSDVAGDAQSEQDYGALYNGFAATDSCNVCPVDWRMPAALDFLALVENLGADAHLQLSDPAFWGTDSLATNSSGFGARPGGGQGGDLAGSYDFGAFAYFWSSTPTAENGQYLMAINATGAGGDWHASQPYGFSIRCVLDIPVSAAPTATTPAVESPLVISHTVGLWSVAWSPDGSKVATGDAEESAQLWDAAAGTNLHSLTGHTESVSDVAFSPDGTRLASASWDKDVRVWDVATGGEELVLTGLADRNTSVAWSPDGAMIAGYSYFDSLVHVWDAVTGDELYTLAHPTTGGVAQVAWSPDGKYVAVAPGNDTRLYVWDAATGDNVYELSGHTGTLSTVAWSPDSSKVASGGAGDQVIIWSAADGSTLHTLEAENSAVHALNWSPDGAKIAVSYFVDESVKIWDAEAGTLLHSLPASSSTTASPVPEWTPDGSKIAVMTGDDTILLIDAATGALLETLTGHTGSIYEIAISPDGSQIASVSDDTTLRIWTIAVK